jgi:hypothetical protein
MFLKIRIRTALLQIFERSRQGNNPYSLEPLGDYIYYDRLNAWLPLLKGLSAKEASFNLISSTLKGESPEKVSNISGSYTRAEMIDDDLVKKIESLEPEKELRDLLFGVAYSYKDGFGF